ncbi:MAG TPA: hypothetical protein VG964_00170 [Candidatus Saccharimonadales bacterium]|nr:hypothetical protein [Candidatus Saccharimonadales bacterium]
MNLFKPKSAIAIFCTSLEIGGEPISSDYYWQAYLDLLLALKARGIEAYFATDNSSYLGGGRFAVAYTTDKKISGPDQLTRVPDVHVDLVFERAESAPFEGKDIPAVNPKTLRDIANNKISIYEHFADLQPKSFVVSSKKDLLKAFAALSGDRVVVKEQEGYGGDSVYIGYKNDVLDQIPVDKSPLLVQQFIDTSGGVPGKVTGVHDVRLEICGGRVSGYYVRMAKAGALHSNVHRGGSMTFLPVEEVPAELHALAERIDRSFAPAPRFYAADFAHCEDGWKLIELNDYVGLARQNTDGSPSDIEAAKSLERLSDYLAACAQIQANKHAHRFYRPSRNSFKHLIHH